MRVDDTITCWGNNDYGQTDAPQGAFKTVSASWNHSCGVRVDDTITCWGNNEDGQTDAPEGAFKTVTAVSFHSCGLRVDDTITCWGAVNVWSGGNEHTQGGPFEGVFKTVAGSPDRGYSCGVGVDDTITCWGDLGFSFNSDAPPVGAFKTVTVGYNYRSCGVGVDDTITCWGGARQPAVRVG